MDTIDTRNNSADKSQTGNYYTIIKKKEIFLRRSTLNHCLLLSADLYVGVGGRASGDCDDSQHEVFTVRL